MQECVATADDEYTAGVLCFDGACQASIVMRRDLRDGNTYRAFVDRYPELNVVVRHGRAPRAVRGPANFSSSACSGRCVERPRDQRRDSRGRRLSHMRAGFNEVEMVLRKVVFGESVVQPEVTPMTILRHWSETVVRQDQRVEPA